MSNNATLDVAALTVPLSIGNGILLDGNVIAAINKTNFTSLLVASNITYGGTIKLFSTSNYSGAFSGIHPASPGTDLVWSMNWISVNGTMFITSTDPTLITLPQIGSARMLGGNVVVAGTNGNAPGTYYYELASTNLTAPLTNWLILATNQFESGGTFNFTNPFDSGKPQQFFILRLP